MDFEWCNSVQDYTVNHLLSSLIANTACSTALLYFISVEEMDTLPLLNCTGFIEPTIPGTCQIFHYTPDASQLHGLQRPCIGIWPLLSILTHKSDREGIVCVILCWIGNPRKQGKSPSEQSTISPVQNDRKPIAVFLLPRSFDVRQPLKKTK